MRLIKIKKDNSIKVSSSTVSLLDPDFCYIPIYNKYNVLVNIGDKVLKDQPLLSDKLGKIITSPISGVIKGVKNVATVNGETQSLVIENDFKEKSINAKGFKNDLSTYKYKDLETILSKLYIPELDGSLSSLDFNKDIKYLVINSIDNEPYVANNSMLLNNNLEDLLEIADVLKRVLKLEKVYIAVSNFETDLITNLINSVGSYPGIELKLINNNYPLILERYFNHKKEELKIINVASLNALDLAIRSDRVVADKMITVTGNAVKEPKIFIIKLGSNIQSTIGPEIKIYKSKKPQFIVNGLMQGFEVPNLNLIVTPNLSSIIINQEALFESENCINCGACVRVCPVKNNPRYVKNNPNTKSAKRQKDDCINCNACSYICPANINFKEIMKNGDQNE